MKALCWWGVANVSVDDVPDPWIVNGGDAIVKITSTAICGSDLHLYNGLVPSMMKGDIMGHEFMGEIVEVGPGVRERKVGDRVVVAFPISCGKCYFCKKELFSLCENTNPNAGMAEKMWGHAPCGIFGYSHLTGGYAGGQAQYVRVPFADVGTIVVPDHLSDEQVLFLSDILPTGYMAAENCDIEPGDTVAVFGCGPVGQFAIRSAFLLGASRVIGIDRFPYRLEVARRAGAETIDFEAVDDVNDVLKDMTGGRGPDSCIDAVGLESHEPGLGGAYDYVKQQLRMETDRGNTLRQCVLCVRNGGTVSVPGVYGGYTDKMPMGSFMNRALKMRTGQTHVQKYMLMLLDRIERGEINPTEIITHRVPLDQAPQAYKMFREKADDCLKVVMTP